MRQMADGETEAAPRKASYFSPLCYEALTCLEEPGNALETAETTRGYEMPATKRFPTTEWFCLEW